MESSRQTTTKIARPAATIMSDTPFLLIGQQLRGRLNFWVFLGDSDGRAWAGAAELPHPCVRSAAAWWGRRFRLSTIDPAGGWQAGSPLGRACPTTQAPIRAYSLPDSPRRRRERSISVTGDAPGGCSWWRRRRAPAIRDSASKGRA